VIREWGARLGSPGQMRIATCPNEDEARAPLARTHHVNANPGTAAGIVRATYLTYHRQNRKSWAKTMASFDRITSNPNILNGQPTIRGMRLSVRRVVSALAIHPNWDDLRSEYPELEPEDIRQALEFAARNLDQSVQPLEPV
jgi:uncharacterized protein (DUF433 family)